MGDVTAHYRYTRYRPPKHRWKKDENEQHKFAHNKRTDILVPPGTSGRCRYRAECTCNWHDPTDAYVSIGQAHRRWEMHMLLVELQQSLEGV